MGAPSSLPAAAALLLLMSLLAGGHCREAQLDVGGADAAGAENYNTSDAAMYWGPWQKARATWYGQPNGAGPDDNGEHRHSEISPFPLPRPRPATVSGALFVDPGNAAHESHHESC